MSIRIKNININNFKIFESFDRINEVDDLSLILLNGPNGYGKTSIFDAVELALTGCIKRIESYNDKINGSYAYENMILVRNEDEEALVSITLEVDGKRIKVSRIYKPNTRLGHNSIQKNPTKIFTKFKLEVEVDNVVFKEKEAEKKLKEYNIDEVKNIYNKCCFISQDEHLKFFKSRDNEKVEDLDFLFNTSKQDSEVSRIQNLCKKIGKKGLLKKLEDEKETLESDIEKLNKKIQGCFDEAKDSKETVYNKIFINKNISWDKEVLELDSDEYFKIMRTVDDLMYFAQNQKTCIEYIFNSKYSKLITPFNGDEDITIDKNPLEYTLKNYNTLDKFDEIINTYERQTKFVKLQDSINKQNYNKINWTFIEEENLFTEEEEADIKAKVERIKNVVSNTKIISKAVNEIIDCRSQLINYFNKSISKDIIESETCPLCGMKYKDKDELIDMIKKQEKALNNLCDSESKEKNDIISKLKEEYFDKLLENIDKILTKQIDKRDVVKAKKVKENEVKIVSVKSMLNEIGIDIPLLKVDDNFKQIYEKILNDIKNKLFDIPQDIMNELELKKFKDYFFQYYDNKNGEFEKVSYDILNKKKQYINVCYFNSNKKILDNKNMQYSKCIARCDKLERILSRLEVYKNSLQNGITNYKRKIIEDIEPILYVYVAKILQRKFNGNSIMIWKNDDLSQIRFINSQDNNQDILHSMSSGQLSSVAIAFLLCMNKIYCKEKIDLLLIDDPIQTIDDVNMVGLVDLLRYEFNEKQIFISTHERKFELYLQYKYAKSDNKFRTYNMKELLLA